MSNRNMTQVVGIVIVGIAIVGVVALVGYYLPSNTITTKVDTGRHDSAQPDTAQSAYPLEGLSALVNRSSAIVIATVGEVTSQDTVYYHGPTATPNPNPPTGFIPPPPSGRPVTYYTIIVETVLRADGVAQSGSPLTLRFNGTTQDEYLEFPMGQEGARYLYFLLGGTGGWYGVPYGVFGRLVIDGSVVTFSDEDLTTVPFASGMTPQQFLDEVSAEVQRQQTATPTPVATSTPGLPEGEIP